MSGHGLGAQDLVVFGVAATALGWLVWRRVRAQRRRARLGAEAPACDSCPGCQSMGVTPDEAEAHVRAGAAGADPAKTAHKRVIALTGTHGKSHN
jgi:hypothetical protein